MYVPHGYPYYYPLVINHINIRNDKLRSQNSKLIRKRTRTGCITCRRRHIKCDERKPHCSNCERSRKICLGYESPTKLNKGNSSSAKKATEVNNNASRIELNEIELNKVDLKSIDQKTSATKIFDHHNIDQHNIDQHNLDQHNREQYNRDKYNLDQYNTDNPNSSNHKVELEEMQGKSQLRRISVDYLLS